MATIKENFLIFSSDKVYNKHMNDVTPESMVFIQKKGEEKLITQNKTFFFIPGNGTPGQVLKKRDGYFSWDDLYNVRIGTSIENLSTTTAYAVANLSPNNQEVTINFTSNFSRGENVKLYITLEQESNYDNITIKLDESKYICVNGNYEFKLEKNKWIIFSFVCTGGNVYVDVNIVGEVEKIYETIAESYLMKPGDSAYTESVVTNSTNIVKNPYEFVVGKNNNSYRETSGKFGVTNTIFTVGNGSDEIRHDALRVMQSGEIFIPNLDSGEDYYDRDMISLQEKLKEYENSITSLQTTVSEYENTIHTLSETVEKLSKKIEELGHNDDDEEVEEEASEETPEMSEE